MGYIRDSWTERTDDAVWDMPSPGCKALVDDINKVVITLHLPIFADKAGRCTYTLEEYGGHHL